MISWIKMYFWIFIFSIRILPVRITNHTSVVGESIELPCNTTYPWADEAISLVLWYRNRSTLPIYTVDARSKPLSRARQVAGGDLVGRAHFNTSDYPPRLIIRMLTAEDADFYRCRVDYRATRTRSAYFRLDIIGEFRTPFASSRITFQHPWKISKNWNFFQKKIVF